MINSFWKVFFAAVIDSKIGRAFLNERLFKTSFCVMKQHKMKFEFARIQMLVDPFEGQCGIDSRQYVANIFQWILVLKKQKYYFACWNTVMIYPKHNRLVKLFFDFYTKWILKSDFDDFKIYGEVPDLDSKPLLVISNHFSWWDGFFIYRLNNLVFKKLFHVMMLEEELQKRLFLTGLGVFGVKKGSRDAVRSLQFSKELLQQRENMVLIFPQGKIESHHKHHFRFEKGIQKLVDSGADFNIVFVVSLIDGFYERKLVANLYMKYTSLNSSEKLDLEKSFNAFFAESLAAQNRLFLKEV